MSERIDPTALSFWFPKIEAAGLPVPRTILLEMPDDAQTSMWAAFDGLDAGDMAPFIADVARAAGELGYPCFLRTDHTSGKHGWDTNCFVPDEASIPARIFGIAEFSEIAGMFGELPWSRWAVREFLPTKPVGVCPNFGNMPICREFRFFVDEGKVRCWHPYWPIEALEQGGAVFDGAFDYEAFCRTDDGAELVDMAERAGKAVGGSWSIDFLETERGWFLTDMAEAHKSFHWAGCEHAGAAR